MGTLLLRFKPLFARKERRALCPCMYQEQQHKAPDQCAVVIRRDHSLQACLEQVEHAKVCGEAQRKQGQGFGAFLSLAP